VIKHPNSHITFIPGNKTIKLLITTPTADSLDSAGGNNQTWKTYKQDIKQILQEKVKLHQDGEDLVKLQNEYLNPYGQNPYCIVLDECNGIDDLCSRIKVYAENFTRLSKSVITRRINYIRLMADISRNVIVIDFLNPSYPQYLYHMNWYRSQKYDEKTGKNFYGLKQRKEAFELYLDACGINKGYFEYNLPSYPEDKPIEFPNPDMAFKITRQQYFKDKDENKMYQMIHLYNFLVGVRPEAEDCVLTLDCINWDDAIIRYPQPKRKYKIREVFVEDAFINGKTRKSLSNYVDHLRPKFVSQYSGEYVFISPKTGKPFSENYLRKQLTTTAQLVYPKFYPYMSRHFCATGRLIQCYIERYPDPIMKVQCFMDHKSRKNTERYTEKATQFYKKYNYNWFNRLLKDKQKKSI